jgi:glycosyltransferase involved in cell wall biosynthesis
MTPKISVVIPSFNKIKYIGSTLDSIFEQKYPNLEVIIQDGGSTDGTVEIIKRFSKRYSMFWESKEDNGQLDAVNKGLNKAKGDILTFINADDTYEPGAFAAISESYRVNSNSLWFSGRGIVVNEDNIEIARIVTWYKNLLLNISSFPLLLSTNYLMQPSVFFTRKAYEKYGPFTGTSDFITEYDLWLRFGNIKMPVVVNKLVARFRIEPSTKTKRMFNILLAEDWRIVNKYTKNPIILTLHRFNNLGRMLVGRFV